MTADAGARVEAARAALKGVHARIGAPETTGAPSVPLAPELAPALPDGLRSGHVVAVTGSTSLMLALVSQASREGAWVAMVGMPQVGVMAAARRGIELARLALVPYPGVEAPTVAGTCLDGMDLVMLGASLALGEPDRRRLAARARERGRVLVVAGPWAGAHVTLDATQMRWTGLEAGGGRLRGLEVTVNVGGRSRGAMRPVTLTLAEPAAPWMSRPGVRRVEEEVA